MFRVCALTILLAYSSSATANDYPCGPSGMPRFLQRLVPQGFAGADFRPACRAHDRCYDQHGIPRKNCDLAFRANMHCACQNSRFPLLCRMAANHRYRTVRLFGGAYRN